MKTLRYILISSLIFLSVGTFATSQEAVLTTRRTQSVALGLDLAPFIMKGFSNDRTGFTVSGRYGLKDKVFAVAELGYENIGFTKTRTESESDAILSVLNYNSNGSFLKAGLDFNIFKVDEPGNNDNVLVGFRYGIAYQEHYSDNFYIGNSYWGGYSGSSSNSPVTSHWLEVVFGLRTELFKNFYLGWGVRTKFMLLSQNDDVMTPYAVPGMGKVLNSFAFGFYYSIEYQIPFGKKQKKIVPNNQ